MLSLTFLIGDNPIIVPIIIATPASPRRPLRLPTVRKDPTPIRFCYMETAATLVLVAQLFTLHQIVPSALPGDHGVRVRATAQAQVSVAGDSWYNLLSENCMRGQQDQTPDCSASGLAVKTRPTVVHHARCIRSGHALLDGRGATSSNKNPSYFNMHTSNDCLRHDQRTCACNERHRSAPAHLL